MAAPMDDVFPSSFSSELDTLTIHEGDYDDCIPFVPYLNNGKINFMNLDPDCDVTENLKHTVKKSYSDEPRKNISWNNVAKRLKLQVHDTSYATKSHKNQDPRLAFRKGRNIFVTKTMFTFGLRHTAPGECHVYETHKQPLLIFVPSRDMQCYPAASFPYDPESYDARNMPDDGRCTVFLLMREKKYAIKENNSYLILTMKKSIFAVYKFRNEDVKSLHVEDFRKGASYECNMRSILFSGSALETVHQAFVFNSRNLVYNPSSIRAVENNPAVDSAMISGNDAFHSFLKRFRSSQSSSNRFTNALPNTDANSDNSSASTSTFSEDFDDDDRKTSVEANLPSNDNGQTTVTEERMNSSNLSTSVINGNLSAPTVINHNDNHLSYININKPSCSSATTLEDSFSAIDTEIINQSTPNRNVGQEMLSTTGIKVEEPLVNSSISTQTEIQERDTVVPQTSNRELSPNPITHMSSNSTLSGISDSRISLNQNDESIQNEPTPFKISDESGNEYLYTPINLNWKESVSGPFILHPFVKTINGKAWAFVPIKIKDAV